MDDWNVPFYKASMVEVKDIVEREGSFLIQKSQTLKLRLREETEIEVWVDAQKIAKKVRSFTEAVIAQQFGEKIIERLYDRVAQLIVEELDKQATVATSLIVVLKREWGWLHDGSGKLWWWRGGWLGGGGVCGG